MTKKNITLTTALLLIALLWSSAGEEPDWAHLLEMRLPSQRQVGSVESPSVLRYKPQRNPNYSKEAAEAYYERRHSLIRGFHGGGQIDRVMSNLKSGTNLLRWMSMAQQREMIQAVPLFVELLNHQDESVRRVATEILIWFGDKRGFDFVMSQMEGPDSTKWWSIFDKDFASATPTEYLPRLKALFASKSDNKVEAYVIAKVLAQMGDADAARHVLPVVERDPHKSVNTILKLANVHDSSVTASMQKLSKEGSPDKVKHAADIVLGKQGDTAAQQRLIQAAKKVISLPQSQNADGTDIPGLKPKFIGEVTPSWDINAVFALEHGMEVVAPEQAVPVLRDIAIHADNVYFSRTAVELLAKIGNEAARNALWDVARSAKERKRTFEDTIFTNIGKALILFDDETSASLATIMFSGDTHGMETSQFLAETRGWDGLFKLEIFY
ncbi:MAG: hypothetical protein ACK5TH_12355 [Prosthecobacter sp.]|jgi:HEAT repeat protein